MLLSAFSAIKAETCAGKSHSLEIFYIFRCLYCLQAGCFVSVLSFSDFESGDERI